MAVMLQPCPACARHIDVTELACPFCSAPTPQGFSASARPKLASPLSRAAILFASATAITGAAACSSSSVANPVDSGAGDVATSDGGGDAAKGDSSSEDTGGAVTLYGPAPIPDAGKADTNEEDSGQPLPAYGPAPIPDSGEG